MPPFGLSEKTASSYLICLLKRREEGLGAGRGGTDVTRV
jgi:hypothetical protein